MGLIVSLCIWNLGLDLGLDGRIGVEALCFCEIAPAGIVTDGPPSSLQVESKGCYNLLGLCKKVMTGAV